MMKRISLGLDQIAAHYTVVVVGSGYGAGVAASRLARAGQSVCVLERGREILPGEYPDDLAGAQKEMNVETSRGTLGSPEGLFNLHMNDDMLAMVGCGLGGTSLINANVALEIDPRLFTAQAWPDEFRNDPQLLAPYVERARQMLDPSPYPADYPPLNKLLALQKSAAALKKPFERPPIAVNFVDQVNPFGVSQARCNLCGDCTSGCNVGAKNTTLMNYLPDAVAHGAHIFTGARVSHVERDGDVWRVHYTTSATPAGIGSVTADVVVLGAGSLGSSEILLRSKQRGLSMSERVGEHFSGNGDVLALGYDSYWQTEPASSTSATATPAAAASVQPVYSPINGVGAGSNTLTAAQLPGPCITGLIDLRGAAKVQDGLVIEEGVIPGAISSLLAPALFFADAQMRSTFEYGAAEAKSRLLDAQVLGNAIQNDPASLGAMAYSGAVSRTQTYLVMSVDDAAGTLRLDANDRLRIDWPGAGASEVIQRDNRILSAVNDAIHGQYMPNPLWSAPLGNKLITVHPLGGCAMGNTAEEGVVNHLGQVFSLAALTNDGSDGNDATAVHEGLYVCDGAVLPGAVGVNPLLTITALAERACQRLADQRGWQIDLGMAARQPLTAPPQTAEQPGIVERLVEGAKDGIEAGIVDVAEMAIKQLIDKDPALLSPSLQFTERMHGWVSLDVVGIRPGAGQRIATDYEVACAWGRALGHTMSFDLTIRADDLHQLTVDPTHPATITGSVTCAALSAEPMPVASGVFHLLPVVADHVETWTMTYEMVLQRGAARLRFKGYKTLHQKEGSSVWADTTTLFVRVLDADRADNTLIAQGILTLDIEDLLWQASTVQVEPPASLPGRIENLVPRARDAIAKAYLAKFGGFFGMTLFRAYGGLLADLNNFPALDLPALAARPLRAPPPELHALDLSDGFRIRLTRYRGGTRGPVMLAPGFSVRASSFATDTVDENLVEALCAAQFDVWLFDYRASPDSGSPIAPYTIDDIARIDWPAAVGFVRQHTGAADVQAIAHCVGSMSLLMAMLDGMTGVRSIVSSQLTLHPVTGWLNDVKADLDLAGLMANVAALNDRFDAVPGTTDLDREIDTLCWNVPVPDGEECKNPLCRRVFATFGPSYAHRRLNNATHTALARMFGTVALKPFEQLSLIMRCGQVVDSTGRDVYLTAERATRLALPITFIAGTRNQLFYPETGVRTQTWLSRFNDPALYSRHVFDDYAHMDLFVGAQASIDVFPRLIAALDQANASAVAASASSVAPSARQAAS